MVRFKRGTRKGSGEYPPGYPMLFRRGIFFGRLLPIFVGWVMFSDALYYVTIARFKRDERFRAAFSHQAGNV